MSSKLKLKKEDPVEETLTCPSCGAPMPVGAVLCVQCGYDTRTKRRAGDEAGKKKNPLLVGALGVVILGAIVIVVLRTLSSSSPTPAPVAPVPTVAADTTTATVVETDTEAAQTETTETNETATVITEDTGVSATNTEEVVEEEQEPAVDWAALEAEQIERATAALDNRAPMHQIGEVVELRMTNGIVQRGEFVSVNGTILTLAVATDDVRQVSVESLDRDSRIRMEPEYRERYIEYFVRQRIMKMQRAAETNAP